MGPEDTDPSNLQPGSVKPAATDRIRASLKAATIFIVLALIFLIALRNDVFRITLPAELPHHTLLRKAYAIFAFAVAGALVAPMFGRRSTIIKSAIAITALSAAIEIGQRFLGSGEWWRWMAFDVATGTVGGLIGAMIRVAMDKKPRRAA